MDVEGGKVKSAQQTDGVDHNLHADELSNSNKGDRALTNCRAGRARALSACGFHTSAWP